MTNDALVTHGKNIENFFPDMQNQRFDDEPVLTDDHVTQTIKKLCARYLLLRLQTYGKAYTRQVLQKTIRVSDIK